MAVVFACGAWLAATPAFARPPQNTSSSSSTRRPQSSTRSSAAAKPASTAQLEQWSRALRDKNSTAAYANLSAFAMRRGSGELGERAALALGYFDYSRGNYAKAETWLAWASSDPLLGDYALYLSAETDHALKHDADAVAKLKKLRAQHPDSAMTEAALELMGDAALAASDPQAELDALAAYPPADTTPALILARGQAREMAGQLQLAAFDYLNVYYHYPLSNSSHEAGVKADLLRGKLGSAFPVTPLDLRLSRAEALYTAHEWYEAREDYINLLPDLAGAEHERAEVRIAQCRVGLGAPLTVLTDLTISDPDADAERLQWIAQVYRGQQKDAEMLAAVEASVARAPGSRWAEQALFTAGNEFWVQLDRDRASAYYTRVSTNYPDSTDAAVASWRVAWTAYREHKPETLALLKHQLSQYPASTFITDNLYWLGRVSETTGDAPAARAYYDKLLERFPRTYFGALARVRLQDMGQGEPDPIDALTKISRLPPAHPMGPVPASAAKRLARADALRSIALDSSAELELRTAYAATGEPSLLLGAAEAAADAGHYSVSISTARQIVPSLEARSLDDVSRQVWRVAYPLPYEKQLRDAARRAGVDPMLVAGLVRQESAFEANAVSHANAYGLMQLLPKTARLLARQLHIGYSHSRLTDPGYNLRLGCVYLAGLKETWGSFEAALAAYNAGEDRVGTWRTGQSYAEPAEFVDSIPFTETREYVQIVLRNAETYRALYGSDASSPRPGAVASTSSGGHK